VAVSALFGVSKAGTEDGMVLLNELLEEAITRCAELTQGADTLHSTLQGLLQRAHDLDGTLASEAEDTHAVFQTVGARLEAAEDRLEEAVGTALGGMEDVRESAGTLRERVSALLETARAATAEMEAERERLAASLQQRTEEAAAAVQELTARVRQLEADAQADLEQAAAAVQEFRDAVEAARDTFETGKQGVVDALEGLEDYAREQTAAVIEAVNTGSQATSEMRVALANTMLKEHNQAVGVVLDRLADETSDHVEEALTPLAAALEELARLCADSEQPLRAPLDQALAKVQLALELAQRIRPVLERGRAAA
jgi:chromosome segregation ATPase